MHSLPPKRVADHLACYRINDPGARRQLSVTVANAAGIAPRPSGDAVTHETYTFAVRLRPHPVTSFNHQK